MGNLLIVGLLAAAPLACAATQPAQEARPEAGARSAQPTQPKAFAASSAGNAPQATPAEGSPASTAQVGVARPTASSEPDLDRRGLRRVSGRAEVPAPDWKDSLGSLFILARTLAGEVALVGSGAQLHTGEQIELHVTVGRPAYVHLIQIAESGAATLLYPVEGEPERMVPGTEYRIPTDPEVRFELDEHIGTERVAFVVTDRPGTSGDALHSWLQRVRATGRWPETIPKPASATSHAAVTPRAAATELPIAPEHGVSALRGFVRSTGDSGRALDVQPDDTGVAIALFTFNHVH